MTPRLLTLLTGCDLPKIIQQPRNPEASTINEKTVADFTRVEATGILKRALPAKAQED